MKKFIVSLALFAILSTVALTGCGPTPVDSGYIWGPIEGWEDIALPEEAEWKETRFSGSVENHRYIIDMTYAEFFNYMEDAMETNEWTLDISFANGRNFLKDDNLVNITTNDTENEKPIHILIVIEPKGAYGDDDEDANEAEEATE